MIPLQTPDPRGACKRPAREQTLQQRRTGQAGLPAGKIYVLPHSYVDCPPGASPVLLINSSDALAGFGTVEEAGCIHQPVVTGRGPKSAQLPALNRVNNILGNIKRSLHGSYHRVSSKHLPRYLAEFFYRSNRRFSLHDMFPGSHTSRCALRLFRADCSSWLRIVP